MQHPRLGVACLTHRVGDLLGVGEAPRLEHELDRCLTDVEIDPLADVLHVEQVASAPGDQRQQQGQRSGPVRQAGEQHEPPPGLALVTASHMGEQARVDVAAREDHHCGAVAASGEALREHCRDTDGSRPFDHELCALE